MAYFSDMFEGEMNLDLEELSYGDRLPDPLDGDTAEDSSFEEDYFENYEQYQFMTDPYLRRLWDE